MSFFIMYLFVVDVFKYDEEYEANEEKYKTLQKEILGESASSGSESDGEEEDSESEDDENESDGGMRCIFAITLAIIMPVCDSVLSL